jgi:hypothetical protein
MDEKMTEKDYHEAKKDQGKLRFSLIEQKHIEQMMEVLEFGAKKYGKASWKTVPDSGERYFDALIRHLFAYRNGMDKDKESGLSHIAHAAVNLMFLDYFERSGK